MTDTLDAAKLTDRVASLVEAARKAGADAADAVAVRGRSTGVSVRLGKVEGTEASESDNVALRVFVGKRVASVSATATAREIGRVMERVMKKAIPIASSTAAAARPIMASLAFLAPRIASSPNSIIACACKRPNASTADR